MPRSFNRGTDKIDLGSSSSLMPATPNLSFAGWAKFDSFAAENWCYARYNSGLLPGVHLIRTLASPSQGLNVFWLDTNGTGHGPSSPTSLSTGIWYHIGGVIDNSTTAGRIIATIYLNGIADGFSSQDQATNPWGTSTLASRLGSSVSGATMAGSLAHWAFWNRRVFANEMLLLANGLHPSHLAPDHYWPLWGNDSPEPDIGNAIHLPGTVTGTTLASGSRAGKSHLAFR